MDEPIDFKSVREDFRARLNLAGLARSQPPTVRQFIEANDPEHLRAVLESRREDAVPESALGTSILERIMGRNDLQPVRFLALGAAAARAVCRIEVRSSWGAPLGHGSGSMVSPRLLLTNHHVINSYARAQNSVAEFDLYDSAPGVPSAAVTFRFRPEDCFVADPTLDYALVAVEPENAAGVALRSRGWLGVRGDLPAPLKKQRVNILQHPQARAMEAAIRDNEVSDILGDFVHYLTDTEPGSSGSPVFDDEWTLTALHHSSVPGDVGWVANEGILLSAIVAHLRQLSPKLPAEHQALVDGMLAGSGSKGVTVPSPAASVSERTVSQSVELRMYEPRTETIIGGPVQVEIGLSEPALVPRPPVDEPAPVVGAPPSASVDYYDAEADADARNEFYGQVEPGPDPSESYRVLGALVRSKHRPIRNYKTARLSHLYPSVDLHPDGKLRSVYSRKTFEVAEVIEAEMLVEAAHRARIRELAAREGTSSEELGELLEGLESAMPFNCEHVVPQSWFGREATRKCDLHHLFTCDPGCNSFRSNLPFQDFSDERARADCGRREGNGFEPLANKGAVARATMYFLLRYPRSIGDRSQEMQEHAIPMLLGWHEAEPPGDWERHRNAEIYRVQGNRNPFVDFPGWARSIALVEGVA